MSAWSPVVDLLRSIHDRHAGVFDGELATYIAELADADPATFGICLAMADGMVYEVGDTRVALTIQSISKPFTYALALDELGANHVARHVGVEPTGEAFNSITLDEATGIPLNAMVNAGAIVAAGLVAELHGDAARHYLVERYSAFAGRPTARPLEIDHAVLESESTTGHRNRAIAHLLRGSGALTVDPEVALDLYFAQCSVRVDCRDLGQMAATLARGGVEPSTGRQVVSRATVRHVLTVMSTCGMYDAAGRWALAVGLPAKSGVSGGIIAVLPGQLGIAVTSPLLDPYGNSERGMRVCADLASELGLQLVRADRHAVPPIRSSFTLDQLGSRRRRTADEIERLEAVGDRVLVLELHGDLDFGDVEQVVRRLVDADVDDAVVDLRRVSGAHTSLVPLLAAVAAGLAADGGALVVSGVDPDAPVAVALAELADDGSVRIVATLDQAIEWSEQRLVPEADRPSAVTLRDHQALAAIEEDELERLEHLVETRSFRDGDVVIRGGTPPDELVLLLSGRLAIVDPTAPEHRRRVETLGPGSVVGEVALATGRPRRYDVVADGGAECAVVSRAAIDRIRSTEPALWSRLLEGVLRVLAERTDRERAAADRSVP